MSSDEGDWSGCEFIQPGEQLLEVKLKKEKEVDVEIESVLENKAEPEPAEATRDTVQLPPPIPNHLLRDAWHCMSCTFMNNPCVPSCEMCGADNPALSPSFDPFNLPEPAHAPSFLPLQASSQFQPEQKSSDHKAQDLEVESDNRCHSPVFELTSPDTWQCDACSFVNPVTDYMCVICNGTMPWKS